MDPLVVCAEPKPLPFSSNTRMYPSLLDQFTSPKKIPVNSGTNGNTVSTDTVSVSRWLLPNFPFKREQAESFPETLRLYQ